MSEHFRLLHDYVNIESPFARLLLTKSMERPIVLVVVLTRTSAVAEGPRDASCQLKSCQLPRNSAETTCTTSPEQIEVMKLEGY